MNLIHILTYLLLGLFFLKKDDRLLLVNTGYGNSSHGIYNEQNDNLLFYGYNLKGDEDVSQEIVVRNNNKNLKIDSNNSFPAIGWLDSSSILIYRVLTPNKQLALNSVRRSRILYVYNLSTGDTSLINEIPLERCKSDMTVDDQHIVYLVRDGENRWLFNFDFKTKRTFEYELLRNKNIWNTSFAYNSRDSILAFIETENKMSKLKFLSNNTLTTIDETMGSISCITFDKKHNRLYYIFYDGYFSGQDRLMKCYDFDSKDVKTVYQFRNNITCNMLSPYGDGKFLLSLGSSDEVTVRGNKNVVGSDVIEVSSNAKKNIFILHF